MQNSPGRPHRARSVASSDLVLSSLQEIDVEQACNIFYILHRILYFLPEVRGEGTCGGGREERSVNHIA